MRGGLGTRSSGTGCTCRSAGRRTRPAAVRRGCRRTWCSRALPAQAVELLEEAEDAGVPYGWVAADGGYGQYRVVRDWATTRSRRYVLSVPSCLPLAHVHAVGGQAQVKRADDLLGRATGWERRSCGHGSKWGVGLHAVAGGWTRSAAGSALTGCPGGGWPGGWPGSGTGPGGRSRTGAVVCPPSPWLGSTCAATARPPPRTTPSVRVGAGRWWWSASACRACRSCRRTLVRLRLSTGRVTSSHHPQVGPVAARLSVAGRSVLGDEGNPEHHADPTDQPARPGAQLDPRWTDASSQRPREGP